MENDLVSIIVPIYNLEKYIDKCIKSLISQTYRNIEKILVDDGSSDNSSNIIDRYKKMDKRICVIHKKNEGVSKARNTGIEASTGQYLSFVDGDDTVDENYIEFLYKSLIQNNADISACGHKDIKDGKVIFETREIETITNNEIALKMLFETNYFSTSVWGKLFKRNLFETNKFDENLAIAEDFDLLFKIFSDANIIYINTKEKHYITLVRNDSASRKGYNSSWKKAAELAEKIIKITQEKFPSIKSYAIKRYMRINFACIKMIILNNDKKHYKEITNFVKNIEKYVKKKDYKLNKKEKIIMICANNGLLRKWYRSLKNIKQKV